MTIIWTAQYNYYGPDRVDITTRKTHEYGQWFAPDWATMVRPYKAEVINEEEYTHRYIQHMRLSYKAHKEAWMWLLSQLEVTFVCFCFAGNFCHRTILARDILDRHFPNAIYRGERVLP